MEINNNTIIKDTDSLIREKSQPVALPLSQEDASLMDALLTYVRESTDPILAEEKNLRPAVGISAIQVGVAKQLCAVVCSDTNRHGDIVNYEYALVNPRIISRSTQKAYLESGEGCLSVGEMHEGYVIRHARVTIKAFDVLQNQEITIRAKGFLAIVLQHELDHFNGVLFYDRINKRDPFIHIPDALVI